MPIIFMPNDDDVPTYAISMDPESITMVQRGEGITVTTLNNGTLPSSPTSQGLESVTMTVTNETNPESDEHRGLITLNGMTPRLETISDCCDICAGPFDYEDIIVWSATCKHSFHLDCMIDYLMARNDDNYELAPCPSCPEEVLSR